MIKNKLIFNDATDWMFDLDKAEGNYIWTKDGKKLIDFTSAWNVTNLGWNNPEICQAIAEQVKKNTHNILWSDDGIQVRFADNLAKALPKGLDTVGRATGGTEANEEALKTARAYTKRKKIIGYKDTYHGQSFGTMAIGYRPEFVEDIAPLVPDFIQIDFPTTSKNNKSSQEILKEFGQKLEELLSKNDIAAIVTEAGIITGWGSTYVAPKGYLKLVRELTKKNGTIMILDEVGTGFSRLGKLFGMELEGVVPDIVTFAKGLSNGQGALGSMVTTYQIAEETNGSTNLTSTFGWNPVAVAAADKTLEIHLRDKVWEQAENNGIYFMNYLKEKLQGNPKVVEVRGLGLEVGIEISDPESAKKVVSYAFNKGLHIVVGDGSSIQLMPPLTMDKKILTEGLEILIDAVNSLTK